jgi:glycosyltransferase involved in cell wall biosynthesis
MKIVHVSKNDLSGGAARAANRQHVGLRRAGYDSLMIVASRSSEDPSVLAFEKPMDVASLVRRGLRQVRIDRDFKRYRASRPRGYELFSDERSSYASTLLDQIPACQIINLHWIPGFVDYEAFFTRVPQSTPVVWSLHDLNPLTGGCHYDLGCDRFVARCGACPQLGSKDPNDLSRKVWRRKERLFSRVLGSRLNLVASSRWLAQEVRRSPILGKFPITIIPYGLDLEEFSPRPREIVRDLLGIPQDARVLLFVAEDIDNKRKGFELLVEAVIRCANRIDNLLLLSVGRNKPEVHVTIPWVHVGTVNNDRFLSMVYSAADLFAICSLQEAFGYTLLEAMACGVPAVGYGVGGILDMVRNKLNGLTVAVTDVSALANAIIDLLNDRARCAEMGANARRIAVEEYSLELQARRYAELYSSLV